MKINQQYFSIWLLVVRLVVAGTMLTHGLPKLSKLMEGGDIKFGDPIGLGATVSLVLAVFSEVVCSILVAVGFYTRLATIPLIITMIVAAFVIHSEDPFGKQELPILYMLVYITLLVFGGGKYSIDTMVRRK